MEIDFDQEQIDLLFEALEKAENFYNGASKRTRNSGYGKATTLEKADILKAKAQDFRDLAHYLSIETT